MNDDTGARAVFTNPEAIWAPATPTGLADALSRAVSADDVQSRARRLSGWRGPTWEDAGAEFVRALRALLVEK
jgi:hypothetical protein